MSNLERVFAYPFGQIYDLYVAKVERKGKTVDELDHILTWLTGHTPESLHAAAASGSDLREFFATAPALSLIHISEPTRPY